MDASFQQIVLTFAIIFLIVILVVIGYSLTNSNLYFPDNEIDLDLDEEYLKMRALLSNALIEFVRGKKP